MKNYTTYNDAASRAMVDMFRRALAPAMEVAAPDWLMHHVEIVRNPHGFERETDEVEIRLCIRPIGSVHAVPDEPPLLKAEQAKDAAEDARMTTAARDVLAERQRQVSAEGWTPEHDDEHRSGDMARAAASYAAQAGICGSWPAGAYMASLPPLDDEERGEMMWPWNREWWKPKNPRADLVRAGALILAEIERMDRAARAAERKA